jgi:hypothetical protein|nr:MAG TPA: hypothetical protein [Caudoviricetes sp.]
METMTIAEQVEELGRELDWADESVALGAPDYGWSDDDSHGRLVWGPVEVEWSRDMYGEGDDDWVAVRVSCDGVPQEIDGYSHLSDAVRDAAHKADDWQHYRDSEIRDEVVSWLEHRGEVFDILGPQDVHDSWSILWGDVMVRGYYDDDGAFVWSVVNPESADYLDGDASDDAGAVIDAMNECAKDPMVEAFREEIEEVTADGDWAVRTSDDGLTASMSDPTYAQSRRARYEAVGYGEGRIELEYRLGAGEWRAYDEHLPEDEADVHAMAREAYEWVKAVAE